MAFMATTEKSQHTRRLKICVKKLHDKIFSFSAKSHLAGVNLVVPRKLCEKRCFSRKFTQLAQILQDRRSGQISTLHTR